MQAVILAGGLGTRLGDITKLVPKPMVSVAGKPYLEHQLLELRRQNIRDVVLLTGYLSERIEEYFGDGSRWEMSLSYSREATPQGTGGALRDAAPFLAEEFLLIYGDSFLPIDYAEVLRRLRHDREATGVVVVYDNRQYTDVVNNIAMDEDARVVRYEKNAPDATGLTHVEAGVSAFRRSVLELLPEGGPVSLENDALPKLIAARRLLGLPTSTRFYDIGTPHRLRDIERLFAE